MKGKALRRALDTSDSMRINADVPLIQDTTELITPTVAREMLKRNTANRPINWRKVEEYADIMARGDWVLHAQGIILDSNSNILTGQKRLWAVVYSDTNVYMRVSRGNPKSTAKLLDRGTPQSARDLASRDTNRKHSPSEASIARAMCVLSGTKNPSVDVLARTLADNQAIIKTVLTESSGTKKTKSVLMILAAICALTSDLFDGRRLASRIDALSSGLDAALGPHTASECWGRGAAFGLAMETARRVVLEHSTAP